jgi:hypothetical protein
MKKVSNPLHTGGLQTYKRQFYYYAEETFQQALGDPLLRKLDGKLR